MNYLRNHWTYFITLVLFLTIVFNFRLVNDLFDSSERTIPINDGVVTEFLTETQYQNILAAKNPFAPTDKILYPFETNFVHNDISAVNLIPLFFLRPFMDIHKATILIVLINIVLANVFMYVLLRALKFNQISAVLGALVFGFSPFVSYRVLGHYTYITHYFFPLLLLVGHSLFNERNGSRKMKIALLWGLIWGLLFYANPYYFIMAVIAAVFFAGYAVLFEQKLLIKFLTTTFHYCIASVCIFLLILLPWLLQYQDFTRLTQIAKEPGLIRSVILSADVFNFFVPSEFNPIYNEVFDVLGRHGGFLGKLSNFFEYNWGRFAYPGSIILLGYTLFIIGYKKTDTKKRTQILPFALAGILFAVLSLGPFLKVFNRWSLVLPEEISIYFPLPFLAFHYLPFLDLLTVPARFIVANVFFGAIVTTFILHEISIRLPKKKAILFFALVGSVFFIDQMYVMPNWSPHTVPLKAYQHIARDPEQSTVLEIPFTVRDGLQYLGDVHAIPIMHGTVLHNKPIIGGYLSRIDGAVFSYYRSLPFIGHTASIIDKGNFNLYKEQPQEPNVVPFTQSASVMQQEIDFLNISYVLLKKQEKYTQIIQKTLSDMGFTTVMDDAGYILYRRPVSQKEYTSVQFGSGHDYLFAGRNFGPTEKDYRWTIGKSATVFVKVTDLNKEELTFEVESFHRSQLIDIYINGKFIVRKNIQTVKKQYREATDERLKKGINSIQFVFSKSFKPIDVLSKSNDARNLAVKFYSLRIK